MQCVQYIGRFYLAIQFKLNKKIIICSSQRKIKYVSTENNMLANSVITSDYIDFVGYF